MTPIPVPVVSLSSSSRVSGAVGRRSAFPAAGNQMHGRSGEIGKVMPAAIGESLGGYHLDTAPSNIRARRRARVGAVGSRHILRGAPAMRVLTLSVGRVDLFAHGR